MAAPDKPHDRRGQKREQMGWIGRVRSVQQLKPVQWIAILVIAVGIVYLSFFFFRVSVCDDQVTNSGKVEGVCRHPQLSDPPVAAIGLVILAFLGVFFSEISGFGVSLKSLKSQVDEARRDAGEARRYALDSLLAAKYNQIRSTMASGQERTNEMYNVFDEMVLTLRGNQKFDINGHLGSPDRGMRLAAYAYFRANPGQPWTPDLVKAVLDENVPFNGEKGLEALSDMLKGNCEWLDDNLRTQLKARAEKYRERAHKKFRDSKRAKVIEAIFAQCPE